MSRQGRLSALLGHFGAGPGLFARGLIKVYRHSVSALTGFHCRHLPTCSTYADEAIGRFGLWAGGWMTLARLSRCHPFGTSGLDFVPLSATLALLLVFVLVAFLFLVRRRGRSR